MVYNTRGSKENKENANTGVKIKISVRVKLTKLAKAKYLIFNVPATMNVQQVSSIYIFLITTAPHHNPSKGSGVNNMVHSKFPYREGKGFWPKKKKESLSLVH